MQSEPATADGIPVLDAATLALGALLAASTDARPTATPPPTPGQPSAPAAPVARPTHARRTVAARHRSTGLSHRSTVRRTLGAAALVMAVLAVGATAGLARPAPTPPVAATDESTAPASLLALGRAAGAMAAEVPPPVAGGAVVVELIDPTDTLRVTATPVRPDLAARLGSLVAILAEERPAP